jgi:hypothetical protein
MTMQRSFLMAAILIGLGLNVAVAAPPDDLQPHVQTSSDAAPVASPVAQADANTRTKAPAPAEAAPRATAQLPAASASAATSTSAAAPAVARRAPAVAARNAAASGATDSIQLGTTQISGNRELPKLMYVVPWRRDQLGNFVGRPPNSLVDEALTPVDRSVFERQNRYYAALQAAARGGDEK